MRIEVCGLGCVRCHAALENVHRALKELGLEEVAEVVEVKDILAMSSKGVFLTPGVVIDGVKVSEGRAPTSEEVKGWIEERR